MAKNKSKASEAGSTPRNIRAGASTARGIASSKWNILLTPWIEALDSGGYRETLSPLEVFRRGHQVQRLVFASPLDLFSAHRFLLTLLYWKADVVGGVSALRSLLLSGVGGVPHDVQKSIAAEASCFELFDSQQPFLQDPLVAGEKATTPAYLFSELASGTNVAHFHHADDGNTQLCLNCATLGMLRLTHWTQSGGSGKTPAIHGAPPIALLALGANVLQTLGLNLVVTNREIGKPQWTGSFKPGKVTSPIPVLEAMTWNPRRVHLGTPSAPALCWRCGRRDLPAVGPIVYEKNEATGKAAAGEDFDWNDPAFFYRQDDPFNAVRSGRELDAATDRDLNKLGPSKRKAGQLPPPTALVENANLEHRRWVMVIPCTNPANNKSYDHRLMELNAVPHDISFPPSASRGSDTIRLRPQHRVQPATGIVTFVSAARRLSPAEWSVIRRASLQPMQASPEAFDLFTGLFWPLRGKVAGLPDRQAAWLTLKLMALSTPGEGTGKGPRRTCRPWESLPQWQVPPQKGKVSNRLYPRGVPRGQRLEQEIARLIRRELKQDPRVQFDWPGLCAFLNALPAVASVPVGKG